jgi:hypothetical protein
MNLAAHTRRQILVGFKLAAEAIPFAEVFIVGALIAMD